jgi:Asp-tRNA(Asn)/Glu-tRNA(Gln) amidotransferase A subunit family amidase
LRAEVQAAFGEVDLLVTPTTKVVAPAVTPAGASEMDILARGLTTSEHTCPFNLTGHPALAVPSGVDEAGLPTSVQIAAPAFEDARAIRAGRVLHE